MTAPSMCYKVVQLLVSMTPSLAVVTSWLHAGGWQGVEGSGLTPLERPWPTGVYTPFSQLMEWESLWTLMR